VQPGDVGLAGAAQLLKIERVVDKMRGGNVVDHTEQTAYAVTSLLPDETDASRLLQLARNHWQIENGQHHRRDRTQDEDRCMVEETNSARVLSLFRSLAIYLYEKQRKRRGGRQSLPDYERHIMRHPRGLISHLMNGGA